MTTPVGKPLGETPFDDDVREWAQDLGLSLNQARDRFILVALQMGNAQPLSCFLLRGYVPCLAVRQHLALMVTPEEILAQTRVKDQLRYRFEIKSRSGKRGPKRHNLAVALRNRRLAKRVADLIAKLGPGSYLAAIKQIASETRRGEQTVRDAYDHGKKTIK
jgi:hypothetical protein